MTFSPRGVMTALLLLTATAGCSRGAPASVLVLDKPEAVLDHDFSQVSNVVELDDGRIALADLHDRRFLFANFLTGEVTVVGEHSDTISPRDPAPGKHKFPGWVIRLPGDTVGLVDFAAERLTLWNQKGEFLGAIVSLAVGGHNQALNYDAKGNSYKEDVRSVLGGLEPGQELGFDSLSVLRIAPGDTVADTVAKLKLPPWGRGQFGEQVKMVSTIFGGRDLFGVLPDGSLWAARASNNAVDWRSPDGKWVRGAARPFATITVTPEEKDSFVDRLRGQMAGTGAPAGIELTYPFADTKPPFAAGTTNPRGEAWLLRSRAFGDSVGVWDVIGRDGRQIRAVQFPRGATLAGFGKDGAVYAILRSSDAQRVARFRVR